jgi:hypothetical protein
MHGPQNRRAFFAPREISDVNDLRLHKVAFVQGLAADHLVTFVTVRAWGGPIFEHMRRRMCDPGGSLYLHMLYPPSGSA